MYKVACMLSLACYFWIADWDNIHSGGNLCVTGVESNLLLPCFIVRQDQIWGKISLWIHYKIFIVRITKGQFLPVFHIWHKIWFNNKLVIPTILHSLTHIRHISLIGLGRFWWYDIFGPYFDVYSKKTHTHLHWKAYLRAKLD